MRNMAFFDEYIISDGKHAVVDEVEQMEKETGHKSVLGTDATHRIYKFPNGYGASVVKGVFTFDKWEVMACSFVDGQHVVQGDYVRFNEYDDIAEALDVVYRYDARIENSSLQLN